jgi:hypothetical protein
MSHSLQLLIERIKPRDWIPTEEDIAASDTRVAVLMNRLDNRRYKEAVLQWLKETFKAMRAEIRLIDHVLSCQQCLIEAQLDVERYLGTRCGLGWLNMNCNIEEITIDDLREGADLPQKFIDVWKVVPKLEHYKIGSYWNGSTEDTMRFIKDRLTWGKKVLTIELKMGMCYRRKLRKWNLCGDPPKEWWRIA